MKIIQISNLYLGRYFENNWSAGNKLRAGIKTILTSAMDLVKEENADLVIFAGDIFDNLDLSQNLLDFFASEVTRLENIPVILAPGNRDSYDQGSFWDFWKVAPPAKNLHILAGKRPERCDFPDLSLSVYGVPVGPGRSTENQLGQNKKNPSSNCHIAVTNYPTSTGKIKDEDTLDLESFETFGFQYVAVCGGDDYKEYSGSKIKAVSSGSPLGLSDDHENTGGILRVDIENKSVSAMLKKIKGFEWKSAEIQMDTIHDIEDLKKKILEHAGQNILLKVNLTGLTLLDTGVNTEHLKHELEEQFLDLQFEDKTRVLPENISEVKVQEKTVLGQYLKVMVGKLNEASDDQREKYERSLKFGYTLLSGREVW